MTEQTAEVLTAERSVAALEWFREFLSKNIEESEAERHLSEIQPTPATVQTIESLRAFLTKAIEQQEKRNAALERQTREYEVELERWKQAGGDEVRKRLDPDAIAEVDVLSDVCAALELSPDHALSKGRRVVAMTKLAEEYLTAQDRLAERECALTEAQAVLRGTVEELGCSARALSDITEDVGRRDNEKVENSQKAKNLVAKAEQYEASTRENREIVRRSGVKQNTTHDAVGKAGEKLRELEGQLAEVEQDLEVYQDFPPDTEACAAMVSETNRQIAEIEQEIEGALSSMMRNA